MNKTVSEINKEWGGKFIQSLNAGEAAIVFAFGLRKDGRTIICTTTDLTPAQLKAKLLAIAETIVPSK